MTITQQQLHDFIMINPFNAIFIGAAILIVALIIWDMISKGYW